MPAQASGLAALLQKMMPGLSAGADKLFMPGGALGAAQPPGVPGQTPPIAPMTGPAGAGAAIPGVPGQASAAEMQQAGGMGQGLAGLAANPAFSMGMGILQGNQAGDPFGGAMRGLQGANQQAIEAEDRAQKEALRKALGDYFASRQGPATADPESPEMQAANYGTAVGDLANQQRVNQILQMQGGAGAAADMDPMLRMMIESGMPGAVNGYGGVNPYMLG